MFGLWYNYHMAYKDPYDPRAREARRRHYRKNKEQYYKNNLLKRERMKQYIAQVKNVPCADCGKEFPSFVMDFDHRDRTLKGSAISKMVVRQSWTKLKAEIEKCDIVCANCHRIRSAKQLGYRKY